LDLNWFNAQFDKGKDFEVSEKQYEELVGKSIPSTHYIKYSSPIAKLAKKKNYKITVDEKPVIKKTLLFQIEKQKK